MQSNQSSFSLNCGSCFSVPSWHTQVTHRRSPLASPVLIETVIDRVIFLNSTSCIIQWFCFTIPIFGVSFFPLKAENEAHVTAGTMSAGSLPEFWTARVENCEVELLKIAIGYFGVSLRYVFVMFYKQVSASSNLVKVTKTIQRRQ